jgi:hypothetical protein
MLASPLPESTLSPVAHVDPHAGARFPCLREPDEPGQQDRQFLVAVGDVIDNKALARVPISHAGGLA